MNIQGQMLKVALRLINNNEGIKLINFYWENIFIIALKIQ